MESGDGVELLLDVGLDRRVTGSAEVEVGIEHGQWSRRQVLLVRHSPSPQEINRAVAGLGAQLDGLLFVVPRAGRALVRAAELDHRVAYAAVDDAVVFIRGELYRPGQDRLVAPTTPGRTSWTRLAILRLFALSLVEPRSQSEIARRIGVSHVAVGKQLPLDDGLVERTPKGWRVLDRAACWDRFMADYPGPRGLATYWAATGDLAAQLERVEHAMRDRVAVSGDFAADFYAPWRRPSQVVVYVTDQPALEEHGFATVRSADATVEVRTPRDPTVLAMSGRYTDPLITAWDVRRSRGGDVDSALEQLRERALLEPLWP